MEVPNSGWFMMEKSYCNGLFRGTLHFMKPQLMEIYGYPRADRSSIPIRLPYDSQKPHCVREDNWNGVPIIGLPCKLRVKKENIYHMRLYNVI